MFPAHHIHVLWGHSVCPIEAHIEEVLKKWVNNPDTCFWHTFQRTICAFPTLRCLPNSRKWRVDEHLLQGHQWAAVAPLPRTLWAVDWKPGDPSLWPCVTMVKSLFTFGRRISSSLHDFTHVLENCMSLKSRILSSIPQHWIWNTTGC